jgi:hypothetical protein
MKSCFFACVAALFWGSFPTLAQTSNMNQWLNSGTEKQRIHRLVSLGVERETAELAVSERDIRWRPIRSESQHEFALLFLPCNGLAAAYLYLSEKADTGWHITDRFGFDCHYDDSVSFETVALRNPEVDDVLVHHACEGHGTGIVQQNLNVLAVNSEKLKLVLNTEEVIDAWPSDGHEMHQRSQFASVPTVQPGSSAIEETRCISDNGKVTRQKRLFNWNSTAFRFQPSEFVKIDVGKKSKGACR